MKCEMKECVLEYLKGDSQDPEIEKHLEQCEQCQALMEGYLAKETAIHLPKAEWINGNLKEQVENYNKGSIRIVVFTIVGLILGLFSYKYYGTDFLPLKIVLGIPYKINEMIHTALHDHSRIYLTEMIHGRFNEFFPQAFFASVFAEYVISSLIGGAIYGSVGFFTGDKRIFTLTKYLRFAAVWALIILISIGGAFFVNHLAVEKNQKFEDISGFMIHYDSGSTGYYSGDSGERGDSFKALEQAFFADGKVKEIDRKRDMENEEIIEFYYGYRDWHSRYMAAYINLEEGYLVSDTGRIFSMSDEFCKRVIAYQKREGQSDAEITD